MSNIKNVGVSVSFKPHQTLRQLLVSPKDKAKVEEQTGAVYRIPCAGCEQVYIGETKRSIGEKLKEHTAKVANNLSAIAEHHQKMGHNPDTDNIKVLCREDKLIPRKVREAISIKKETSPTLNRDGGVNFQEFMIPFWKHRDQGRHLRQISEEDQSVAIQLPPAEDGDGYHRNIRIKNVSVVE